MAINQYSLFLIIAFLAGILSAGLAGYAWRYRSANGAATFSVLMVGISVWTLAIGFGMLARTEQSSFIWSVVRMAAVFSVPVLWFAFANQYSDRQILLRPLPLALLSIIPLISMGLMATTNRHHLFLEGIRYVRAGGFLIDEEWLLGPFFWMHLVYSYTLILLGDVFIIQKALRLSSQYRRQAAALFAGALVPLLVNGSFTFHLFPNLKINYDPLGFVFAGVAFAFALFQYRLFDLTPIAHQLLINSMSDGVVVLDERGRVVDLNPAAQLIFDMTLDRAIGKSGGSLFPADFQMKLQPEKSVHQQVEITLERKGQRSIYDLRVSPVRRRNYLVGHLLVLREITQRKIKESKLQEMAVTDSLTGLYNHGYFYELGVHELNDARQSGRNLAVILLDVDDFKQVNDTYGHQAGDRLLKQLADVCRDCVRQSDLVARYGGEEFAILLLDTALESAWQFAQRLGTAIQEAVFMPGETPYSLSASMGVSAFTGDPTLTFERLVKRADESLYQAKSSGKNRVTVWRE